MKKACFCGKVTMEFPEKPLLHFMCHCVDCDLLWNGAYMGFVFPTDEVSVEGDKSNFKYTAGSGLVLEIDFCSHCGTKVASRPEIVDGLTYIPAGFLKNELEFSPQVEIFAYNKYKCFGNPDTLVESFDHNGTLERISAVIEAMSEA